MSRCDGLGDPATQAAKAQAVDRGLHRTGSQVIAVVATLASVYTFKIGPRQSLKGDPEYNCQEL